MPNWTYGGSFAPFRGWSLLTTDPRGRPGSGSQTGRATLWAKGKTAQQLLGHVGVCGESPQVANNGQLVGNLRLQRHQLTDVHAGDVGPDRGELPPVLHRGFGLHVIHIHVRWGTAQVDHDDGLARCLGRLRPARPKSKQIGQCEAADAQCPRLQKVPAREAAAERFSTLSPNGEHSQFLQNGGERPNARLRSAKLLHAI